MVWDMWDAWKRRMGIKILMSVLNVRLTVDFSRFCIVN